jgi:hypothetical protein
LASATIEIAVIQKDILAQDRLRESSVNAAAKLQLASGSHAKPLSSAFAQHISVGIKAGVPLTNLLGNNSGDAPSQSEFPTQTKRYTIGPIVNIGLPLGFGVELAAMYKRFDQRSIAVTSHHLKFPLPVFQ